MNENAIIQNVPAASGLHKVPGFDPLRYLKRTVNAKGETVLRMELGYQKLWFRLACPNGRLLLNPLRITDQMALIEASVFFDRADSTPAGSFTATGTARESANYIRDTQNEALSAALENAGFGIQLSDTVQVSGGSHGLAVTAIRAESPAPHNNPPAQVKNEPARTKQETSVETRRNLDAAAVGPQEQAEQNPVQQTADMMAEQQPERSTAQADVCEPEPSAIENDPNSQSKAQKSANVEVVDFLSQMAKHNTQMQEAPAPESSTGGETTPPASSYPTDMPVEEICKIMTLEQARAVVVPTGTCKGWTLEKVAADRRSSLKFYVYSQGNVDNVVKAAATLLWNELNQEKAG